MYSIFNKDGQGPQKAEEQNPEDMAEFMRVVKDPTQLRQLSAMLLDSIADGHPRIALSVLRLKQQELAGHAQIAKGIETC